MGIEYNKGYVEGIAKAIELFTTHEEGFGAYCDTGSDMDWACRSECMSHGLERCNKHLSERLSAPSPYSTGTYIPSTDFFEYRHVDKFPVSEDLSINLNSKED